MSCQEQKCAPDLIQDLIDGQLPPNETEQLRRHLAECDDCRAEAEQLGHLLAQARALPRTIEPAHDLWPEIAAEIESRRVINGRFGRNGHRLRPEWPQVMAVAAAVVMAVAVIASISLRQKPAKQQIADATPSASDIASPGSRQAGFAEARSELLAIFEARSSSFSPQTLTAVMDGLRSINESITGIGAALEKNPEDTRLAHLLASAQKQELDLLQRAVRLPNEI